MTRYTLNGLTIVGLVALAAASDALGRIKADADPSVKPATKYLDAKNGPKGEGWFALFNGKDLTGWHRRKDHDRPLSWKVANGAMVNDAGHGKHGTDIVTDLRFDDFELYFEYRVPKGSNSGMYLRGLYEIQIREDGGAKPDAGTNGGIWATAAPKVNASKPPDEWQSVYTRLVGQTVKVVVLNGVTIHENVNLPKPTGGDLRKTIKMNEPGPILIQGDHGTIEVRTVMIKPLGKYIDAGHAPAGKGWIALCNGKDLTGWHQRPGHEDRPLSWKVVNGVMVNTAGHGKPACDIVTDRKFDNFELYYEYRIPKGSNSGMYLRGRYEIQIADDHGRKPSKGGNGALYSLAAPAHNVSRPAGQWQSVCAKIVGKKVTVILNGTRVIDNAEATRPTGGERDRDVDQPGPIMIQGDHGPIEVRNIMIKPLGD